MMNYKNKKQQNKIWIENMDELNTLYQESVSSTNFNYDEDKKECLQYSIRKTKLCRFNASGRLTLYNNITNWMISIVSLALIILSVWNITMSEMLQDDKLNFVEIALAIMILVFSLLIANYNYAVRALQFHLCGIELSELDRRLDYIKVNSNSQSSVDKFKQIYKEYTSILKRYENHATIDFEEYRLYNKLISKCNYHKKSNCEAGIECPLWCKKLKFAFFKNIIGLLPQWLLLVTAACLIVWLFWK